MASGTLQVHQIEGQPRILDTDLAVKLGYEEPVAIRRLILRNMRELEGHGITVAVTVNTGKRGRRPTVHYLNEAQALLIVMKADTKNAQAARAEIIAVFQAYRHGKLVPATSLSLPDFTNPALMARVWADQYEANERLMLEGAQKDETHCRTDRQAARRCHAGHSPYV